MKLKNGGGKMCYRDNAEKIIFSKSLRKRTREKLMAKALEEFYGKFEVPSEKIDWSKKRVPNGGLVEKFL